MTDVICVQCHEKIGEYYGSARGAGKELRDRLGGICPKCGHVFRNALPLTPFPWQRAYWTWTNRRGLLRLVVINPITVAGITGLVMVFDLHALVYWLIGVGGGMAIGLSRLVRERMETKEIVVRA